MCRNLSAFPPLYWCFSSETRCWRGAECLLSDFTLDFPSVLAEIEDVCVFLPRRFPSGNKDLLQSPTTVLLPLQIL